VSDAPAREGVLGRIGLALLAILTVWCPFWLLALWFSTSLATEGFGVAGGACLATALSTVGFVVVLGVLAVTGIGGWLIERFDRRLQDAYHAKIIEEGDTLPADSWKDPPAEGG
jgi:hypothetical protein